MGADIRVCQHLSEIGVETCQQWFEKGVETGCLNSVSTLNHDPWLLTLLYPWLCGCRAGAYTHATELEALSQSWGSRGGLTYRLIGAQSLGCLLAHRRPCERSALVAP